MADDNPKPIWGPGSTTIGTPTPEPPPWVNVTPPPPTTPTWGGPPNLPAPTGPYNGPYGQADGPEGQDTVAISGNNGEADPQPDES
jgi:hypothetical protein